MIEDCNLEELVNEFTDRQRCRRAVAAIATSSLDACGPLLASKDSQPCLLALDTVEVLHFAVRLCLSITSGGICRFCICSGFFD